MFSIQKGVFILAIFLSLQTVIKGECENVPQVPESSNNATQHGHFAAGSAIEFTCNPGYKGVGSTYFYCRGSEWAGNFSCLRVCPEIRMPKNGLIVRRTVYGVTTELEFACRDGYTLFGYSSMFCWADGNWSSDAPPTCDPVSCGYFGSVPNGEVFQNNSDDVLNHFGSEVRISCNEGYNLIGSPTVTCKSDGKWSPRPECEASLCGTHPGTKSQCIYDSSTSDNGVLLSLLCHDNYANRPLLVIDGGIAFCMNNQWDNLDMGCFCDCLVDIDNKDGISYNNLYNKKFVKHGDQLNWDCTEGYRKQGSTDISCYDGLMEKPHCVRQMEQDERSDHGTLIPVIVTIIVLSMIVIFIVFSKVRYFNEKKGRENEADEERPMTERSGGTTTAPLIDQSYRDQCDYVTSITQSTRDQSDTETATSHSSHDQSDFETPTTQTSHNQSDFETPTTQTSHDRSGTETATTKTSSDKSDIETSSTQTSHDQRDKETPTTQTSHDQSDTETPTTLSSHDRSDTETATTQTSPISTRVCWFLLRSLIYLCDGSENSPPFPAWSRGRN